MKNKIILPLLLIALLLAACGGTQSNFNSNFNAGGNGQGNGNASGTGQAPTTLPLAEKLAIGTLKLENTSYALTSKQAGDLLPLWQVYSSLLTSDTAAQEEKDALAQQIQETMTSDQINTIDGMNLTQRDIFASIQQLGLTTSTRVNANATPQPNGGGFPGGGQFFGGGGGNFTGGGGGNFNGGGNRNGGGNGGTQLTPQQIATAQARRAANGGNGNGNRFMEPLVTAVIKLLQNKLQSYP